eukprot:RCo027110
MALTETFAGALRRDLTVEEVELLQLLSPQGVAKVNADLAQGVNLELTLMQLRMVFHAAKKRHALVEAKVPPSMRSVAGQMRRSLTADELTLFAGVPPAILQHMITCRTEEGESLEDIVQELAEEHRQKQLHCDAKRLGTEKGRVVLLTQLCPTQLNVFDPTGLMVSVTELEQSEKLRVGPGPVTTWFRQSTEDTFEESGSLSSIASQESVCPRPSLKRRVRRLGHVEGTTSALGSATAAARAACYRQGMSVPAPEVRRVSFGGSVAVEEEEEDAPTGTTGSAPRKRGLFAALSAALRAGAVLDTPRRSPPAVGEARREAPKRPPKLPRLKSLFAWRGCPVVPETMCTGHSRDCPKKG